MKAGIFYESYHVGVEELPKPVPGPGEVVLRVLRAGICGSEVGAYRCNDGITTVKQRGDNGADGQFGHEMVGMVDAIGEGVTGIEIGDIVWPNPTCARKGGLTAGMAGSFSEYMVVEEAGMGYNLEKWNPDVNIDFAALMEPMCVAARGKNQAQITAEDNVVIYGCGAIGLCALALCLRAGCKNPVIVDRHAKKLEICTAMGGTAYNAKTDGDISTFLMNHFGAKKTFFGQPRPDVNAVIDCAGGTGIFNEVMSYANEKLRISLVGGCHQLLPADLDTVCTLQVQIRGSRAYEKEDVIEAQALINSGEFDLTPIISYRFPLDDIAEAFKTAEDRTKEAIKVIVEIGEK